MKQLQAGLPAGFQIEVGGALEESQEAAGMMLRSFGISFVAIVLLLVIQFNSVSKTLIIITTLPLALIGALGGLWLTNNPLGFMPQLGVLSLFGIVLNTGIIYIEFADMLLRSKAEAGDDANRDAVVTPAGIPPVPGRGRQATPAADLSDHGDDRRRPVAVGLERGAVVGRHVLADDLRPAGRHAADAVRGARAVRDRRPDVRHPAAYGPADR